MAYPVFLSLEAYSCLVVGLGSVGCRKLASVLEAGIGRALVLDLCPREELSPEARDLLRGNVRFEQRPWRGADVRESFLVFACTGDKLENSRIAAFCRQCRVLCNDITTPGEGSFVVPAVATCGGLTVALTTGGQSPMLARRWRRELEAWLEPRSRQAWLLGRLRPHVLALGWSQDVNREFFATLADDHLGQLLTAADIPAVKCWLEEHLPRSLRLPLEQILTEFAHAFS